MIFNWLDHPSFHRDEQLIAILYDLGMASKRQLQVITGWHPLTLKDRLRQIRKRGRTKEEKDLWLKAYPIPGQSRDVAYSLGRLGLEYAQEMALQLHRVREAPKPRLPITSGSTTFSFGCWSKGFQGIGLSGCLPPRRLMCCCANGIGNKNKSWTVGT